MRIKTWKGHEAEYLVLAKRVMTIAIANTTVGDWAAYIDAITGENHDEEFIQLLEKRSSAKLPYEVAKILYPHYDSKYVWRK